MWVPSVLYEYSSIRKTWALPGFPWVKKLQKNQIPSPCPLPQAGEGQIEPVFVSESDILMCLVFLRIQQNQGFNIKLFIEARRGFLFPSPAYGRGQGEGTSSVSLLKMDPSGFSVGTPSGKWWRVSFEQATHRTAS